MRTTITTTLTAALATLLISCGGGGGSNATVAVTPATASPPAAGRIGDGRLDELIEWARAAQAVPAMGAILVVDGQIAETGAVGKRSASGTAAVTVEDQWHLGSLTKAMTATLAGVLVEQSVLSWNTSPLDVWPELDQSIDPQFRNITIKQLLSHTAGMRRADVTPAQFGESAPGSAMERRRRYAAQLLSERPVGPVGVDRYSNGGYIVAGAMLETVMSTPWEQLLTEQVFGPLGMNETGFGAPGAGHPRGHWDTGPNFEPVSDADADNPDTMGPAGTVHATMSDYASFMLAHLAGARGIGGLVTAGTFDTLHTAVTGGSALGWGVLANESWADGPVLAHSGSNGRWFAVVRLAPALDAGLLVVVNAGGHRADEAVDALGELILGRYQASRP